MARYKYTLGAYKDPPRLHLSLRTSVEGGALRAAVLQAPDKISLGSVVVLVHGFNNHHGDGCDAYWNFTQNQNARLPPGLPGIDDLVAGLFWPGDAAWGVVDITDFLIYPSAVGTAQPAGVRLAQHLAGMPTLREVHFIGHSLGCRVILEAINHLRSLPRKPAVGKAVLMAAAVPVFKLKPGGSLHRAFNHAGEMLVLYSPADLVLQGAFRAGQSLAKGPEGFLPTALGTHGEPDGSRNASEQVHGAGHSDYWPATRKAGNTSQAMAADKVSRFFGWAAHRALSARPAAIASPVETRPAMGQRALGTRQV